MSNVKQTSDKIDDMYQQLKDSANKAMKEGKKKVMKAERSVEHFSDELIKEIREKPLRSILVAGGIGYILATLLGKK